MPREVVTLQLGRFANYVGAHLWNLQDEAAGHAAAAGEGEGGGQPGGEWGAIDGGVTWDVSRGGGEGGATAAPRVLVVDAAANLGAMPAAGGGAVADDAFDFVAGAQAATGAAQDVVASWDGAVQVRAAERVRPSAFVGALYSERDDLSLRLPNGADEEDEDYGEDGDYEAAAAREREREMREREPTEAELAARRAEDERVADELEAAAAELDAGGSSKGTHRGGGGVRYWSDFLKTDLGSRSVHALRGIDSAHAASAEAWRADGAALWATDGDLRDAIEDGARRLVEACDSAQGFVLLSEEGTGMGGIADEVRTLLADDYPAQSVLTFAAESPEVGLREGADGMAERRRVGAAMGLAAAARASESRGSYVPLGVGERFDSAASALGFDVDTEYRAAAAMAACIDTATLCTRATRGKHAAGDLLDLDALLRALHPEGAHIAAASLALPMGPPPYASQEALLDSIKTEREQGRDGDTKDMCASWLRALTPLSSQLVTSESSMRAGGDVHAAAESLVLRGWDGTRADGSVHDLLAVWSACPSVAWPTSRRMYAATTAPLPLPLPFPIIGKKVRMRHASQCGRAGGWCAWRWHSLGLRVACGVCADVAPAAFGARRGVAG